MKTYEVELKRTSYVVVVVEAKSAKQAEAKAFEEISTNHVYGDYRDASWEVEYIEEV